MLKKIILGGIALAATGYGIKKLYDVCTDDEVKSKSVCFEDDMLHKSEILKDNYFKQSAENFTAIQKNLFKISHFEKEILNYEFKDLDFKFDNENFQQRMKDFNKFVKKYQEDLNIIVSKK